MTENSPPMRPRMRCLELERKEPVADIIRRGLEEGWTLQEVAQDLGITRLTLRDWMQTLGLEVVTRKTVVARQAEVEVA